MGRRLSWLDRLYPISRSVAGSARSHYDRKDLQQLFEIQPRSAQNLMAALPTVPIGRAHLVERRGPPRSVRRERREDRRRLERRAAGEQVIQRAAQTVDIR